MKKVYVLTNQVPDWSAPVGAPRSVHETVDGAKRAFADGRYIHSWKEVKRPNGLSVWYGPDGYGSIIEFEVQP